MKSASPASASTSAAVIKLAPRRREEIEFLPAALEVVETPPSPTGRITLYAIAAVFALTLAWAALGKVDIVAVAPGRIVPTGNSKIVQPLETAIVTAIHVRDGQAVKAGDMLIELDTTSSIAEGRKQQSDLMAARLDATRLRAALASTGGDAGQVEWPPDAPAGQVAVQRSLLTNQVGAHVAKVAGLDRQVQQRVAEQATIEATIAKLEAALPLVRARFEIRDEMSRKQLGSKIVHLENKQALIEGEKELLVQKSHLDTAAAAIAVLSEQRKEAVADFARVTGTELVEAERKVASLREELVKAQQRTRQLSLTAPIDGTIQQLAVHTIGGVVGSAQSLLVVVPQTARIEIEAMVSNRDIGFVRVGQEAEIKVEAFDFTRYGLMRGRIESISRDAVVRGVGERDGNVRTGEQKAAPEPRGQDLMFAARLSLDRTTIDVDGRPVDLAPGMATTIEIKTGSRSILSFLLSPVARYRQEAMRER